MRRAAPATLPTTVPVERPHPSFPFVILREGLVDPDRANGQLAAKEDAG